MMYRKLEMMVCCIVEYLRVWSMKNHVFRVWGWKTKISFPTAVVRDRVRDDDVLDDTCTLPHVVLQQNVLEVGVCSVRPGSVP